MFEEIMRDLLGRPGVGQAATLHGWSRHALKDRAYPGAVFNPAPGSKIDGFVWLGLSDEELLILDQFESSEYERIPVTIHVTEQSETTAWLYAWKDETCLLLDWDPEQFTRIHRPTFVRSHSRL